MLASIFSDSSFSRYRLVPRLFRLFRLFLCFVPSRSASFVPASLALGSGSSVSYKIDKSGVSFV